MTVSSAMAALLRGVTETSWAVERTFTEIRLGYDLFVPDADGGTTRCWCGAAGCCSARTTRRAGPRSADACSSTP
ncbi:hypothetical protein O7622_13205 [Micromonospora sp. WMMD1076]|uniref:hypothetical protein n=1 Tax=Micromonospora sp. WMMD1076 TaxID=3016103 RepID=UPI002499B45C|nr:hypothetical protein [Micromonospora sp. WMMD1076]WFF09435.1 hypothetical protein O7622_13205 [Micromonospora sp. WMMD1076]